MYIFKFADIGEGIHEGKISDIHVKVGDSVKDGTDLFSVETDKITTEVASPVNGKILKILCNVGDVIHVGDALFEIDDGSSTTQESKTSDSSEKNEETKQESSAGASVVGEVKVSNDVLPLFGSNTLNVKSASKNETQEYKNENVLASPVARAIAKQNHIKLVTIKGSGPNGRITKQDVLNSLNHNSDQSYSPHVVAPTTSVQVNEKISSSVIATQAQPLSTSINVTNGDKVIEMSSIRKAIAAGMKRSWSNVAYTNLSIEIDVTDIWEQRNKVKDFILETENIKLTLLPFIVKAISKSLTEFPLFNAVCDDKNNTLVLRKDINIGIAVDTKDGLIVPNIKNADKLSILEIAKYIADIASKARNKKVSMNDITNGTFSITNYGSLGANFGVPVINYPEVAIAGLGAMHSSIKKVGIQLVERKIMYITIAADHRWIDGGDIARFGNQIKQYLENITLLFI